MSRPVWENTIMINLKSLLAVLALLCSAHSGALEFLSPLPQLQNSQARWLASTQDKQLLVLNNQFQPLVQYPGSYEQTSAVRVSADKLFIAAINAARNSLDLLSWDGEQLTLMDRQVEPLQALTGVCLFQQPQSENVHAFLLKEHTEIEQRLVFQSDSQGIESRWIRNLPVPDGIEACGVDHQRQALYLVEGGVGIWRMSAHPESEKQRKAVSLAEPFGELEGDIESLLVLDDGTVAVPQQDSVAFYHPDGTSQKHNIAGLQEAVAVRRLSVKEIQVLTGDSLSELTSVKLSVAASPSNTNSYFPQIPATAETDTVQKFGDAADDPAIWFNADNPEASLILGTDKKRGLAVYNLNGRELQFLEVGRINNVDLREGFVYQGKSQVLAAASQRDNHSIALFLINELGTVAYKGEVVTSLDEVYGLCMFRDDTGHYVFINDKDGRYQQYHINTEFAGKMVREFKVSNQPEGCVANDVTGDLFVGVEDEGIWHLEAQADSTAPLQNIVKVGGPLKDDVEGMALYLKPDASYLVVSSQGNNSYALYSAKAPFDYIASFEIAANLDAGVDGASETDGLDVSSANYGGRFSEGLLVVQDGRNVMPQDTQNFKLVAFGDILQSLELKQ